MEYSMQAKIISKSETGVEILLKINFTESMLESEGLIQDAVNDTGKIATSELLSRFDTDGSKISIGKINLSSKGRSSQMYQTPYGEVNVTRHVYQSSKGGKTYCPMEHSARILLKATPRYAKQVSHKSAEMASTQVAKDMLENHNRSIPRSYIKKLSEAVASIIQTKEESWSYQTPEKLKNVSTISIGLDGTCMFLCKDGYRQAMVGTLTLYDKEGGRLHTTYVASEPEYGKHKFKKRMDSEIEHIKKQYPNADRVGLADGAADNWNYLNNHVDTQILDFYHATEYLSSIAPIVSRKLSDQQKWLKETCHDLKHNRGAALKILNEMKELKKKKLSKALAENLSSAITYFSNHNAKMAYAEERALGHPIGSGVTEAGCKVIVKQRMCKSGMKWKDKGASAVLSLRSLTYSDGRWKILWSKINQYGF